MKYKNIGEEKKNRCINQQTAEKPPACQGTSLRPFRCAPVGLSLFPLLIPFPVLAYIDPGSASLPLQNLGPFLGMLAALLGGALFVLRRFLGFFKKPPVLWAFGILVLLLSVGSILHILKNQMSPPSRVIVIGMDGLDHRLLRQWMEQGYLPHFAKVAETGSFLPLETVSPPQSPVAWCSFATGTNPGVHGVFDFLQRTPQTYYPHLTLMKQTQDSSIWNPVPFEKVRAAPAFWEATSARGIPTVILRHPVTFPPEKVEGRMLSGLGVPDLVGGLGRYTYYVEQPFPKPDDFRGELVSVTKTKSGWAGAVPGPKDSSPKRLERTLTIHTLEDSEGIRISVDDLSWDVAEGGWSPWVHIDFKTGALKKVRSLSRFYLARLNPLRLYQTPLNFDPEKPVYPVSHPEDYSRELAETIGPFYTLGMDEDTNALSDETLSEEAFIEQCRDIVNQRDAMFLEELGKFEKGLLVCVYDTPDRVEHMFWRAIDPQHPLYEESAAYRNVVLDFYKRMDETLGKVLPFVDKETLLLVASDHGFASFRKALHLNRWLVENGYMNFKPGVRSAENFFQGIDWSKTKAYSLGLGGGIYVNLKGREPSGSVAPADVPALIKEISEKIAGLKDPATGEEIVRKAAVRETVFTGPRTPNAPELTVMLKPGYRVSWQTALGGVPGELVEIHNSKWSGDHTCNLPEDVPGILVSNRSVQEAHPRLSQMAATIVRALGAAPLPEMEAPITFK